VCSDPLDIDLLFRYVSKRLFKRNCVVIELEGHDQYRSKTFSKRKTSRSSKQTDHWELRSKFKDEYSEGTPSE
jgi:hypothetical protein